MTKSNTTTFQLKPLVASLMALGLSTASLAAPQEGVVRAGSATINVNGNQTQIQQSSDRAVIDWRSFSVGALESVVFNQPSRLSSTLNRVTGDQVSVILGKITANGQVAMINPNGIIFGAGSQINVGGLIASTANISNNNFMQGRLVFDQPGKPGASILNQGTISAADGGLVALVAPTVRNDGIIQARLGKVVLGAGDTFTLDLYGDQLISLAMTPEQTAQIVQAGHIAADGGQVVLVSAPTAKAVLDQVINMSGTIRADSIAEQNGKIVLLGAGGEVTVSGQLSAHGGRIEVLGDKISLASSANLDTSGANGGGTIHVGGAFQGSGDTYRAQNTDIAAGARLSASATDNGNGGEVVVWSDQQTRFAGDIAARGGALGGNGGRLEVSGKGTLEFLGTADASAPKGAAGSLLLDPTDVTIGRSEASLINRVLRTGTSTTVQASNNIDVNSVIDGRGNIAGGGLTLTAGNNLNINEFIVTNNGAINLNAGGTLNFAANKAVIAGNAPISATSTGNLTAGPLVTTGSASYRSTAGSIFINTAIGASLINAAQNIVISQPIGSLGSSSPFALTAGGNITVGGQLDIRDGASGRSATLTAGGNIAVNESILSNNGAVNLSAGGTLTFASNKGVFAGSAPISVSSVGDLYTGPLITTSTASYNASGGSVFVNQAIGTASINAAQNVSISQPIVSLGNNSPLAITAGGNITVGGQLDDRDSASARTATLTAGGNIAVNESILTNNGAVSLNAGGTLSFASGKGVFAGSGAISATSVGDLSTGPLITTGSATYNSTGGSVNVNQAIDNSYRAVTITAAQDVNINQAIANLSNGSALSITAGDDINVNAAINGRGGVTGGTATLVAGGDVFLNNDIATNNAALNVTATSGTLTPAGGGTPPGLFAGNGAITVRTGGNLSTGVYATTGALNLRSTSGAVNVDTKIAETIGNTTIQAAGAVNVNQAIANIRNGSNLNITAGSNIVVNAQIDALDDAGTMATPVAGGAVTLTAGNNVTLNESIATFNGAVNVTATNGTLDFKPGTVFTGNGDAKRILAGSAPITITTGGNFTTGEAPPSGLMFANPAMGVDVNQYIADSLKPWVTLVTTGKLTLSSTSGNISVDAPIPNTTGEIEINGGNGVVVNHKIITNSQLVTINAGAGGVTINPNVNGDQYLSTPTASSAAIDTKDANLIIRSVGNINIVDSIASNANIILDTRGALLRGTIADSNGSSSRPDNILISADQGVGTASTFIAGTAPNVEAYSLSGNIAIQTTTTRLRLGTGFNAASCINTPGTCMLDPATFPSQGGSVSASGSVAGYLGQDVVVVAGGPINIPYLSAGEVTLTSSQNIPLQRVFVTNLTARAQGNITFDFTASSGNPGSVYLGGALTATSTTGNILFNGDSAVHLGNGADLMLTANTGSVAVRRTELNGAVIVNAGQDITFYNPIGADIRDSGNAVVAQYANGVSGVDLNAGGNINIQGARSSGLIDIDAVGTFTSNGQSVFSALSGTPVTIDSSNVTFAGTAYLGTSIATQAQLEGPNASAPAIPPGPQVSPPGAPAAISAPPSSAPGALSLASIGTPSDINFSTSTPSDVNVGVSAPAIGGDSSSTTQSIPPGPVSAKAIAPGPKRGLVASEEDSGTSDTGSGTVAGGPAQEGNSGASKIASNSTPKSNNRFKEIIPDANEFAELGSETQNPGDPSKEKIIIASQTTTPEGPIVIFSGGRGAAQLADLGRGNALSTPADVFSNQGE